MQHKRSSVNPAIFKLAAAVLVIGVLAFLMTAHVPAPQKSVEKELDAKAFDQPQH